MFCPKCGQHNPDASLDCAFCGAQFPPHPSAPYPPAPAFPRPSRPGVLTAVAVLGLISGASYLLFLPLTLLELAQVWPFTHQMNPLFADPFYRTWTLFWLFPGTIACVLWIVAAVGLFVLAPWARKLAVGLMIYALATTVINTPVNLLVLLRSTQLAPFGSKFGLIGGIAGGIAGSLAVLALWAVLLVFSTRPYIARAYDQAAAAKRAKAPSA